MVCGRYKSKTKPFGSFSGPRTVVPCMPWNVTGNSGASGLHAVRDPVSGEGDCVGTVWLGGRPLHPSHALSFSSNLGLWYCTTCGQYAALAARGLGLECGGRLLYRGRKNLAAIARGDWPQVAAMPATHARHFGKTVGSPPPQPAARQSREREVSPRVGQTSLESSGREGPGPSGAPP